MENKRTLAELRDFVNQLIESNGESSSVSWWIYTPENVFEYDNMGKEVHPNETVCEQVLEYVQGDEYIPTVIFYQIEERVRQLTHFNQTT